MIFAYTCAAGGAGLSRTQVHDVHGVLCALEVWAGGETPFQDRFSSKSGFYKAIRRERRRTLRDLGWSEWTHWSGGTKHKMVFREDLDVVRETSGKVRVGRWTKGDVDVLFVEQQPSSEDASSNAWAAAAAKRYGMHDPAYTGLMDGNMWKKQLHDVHTAQTLPEETKMVGVELFSDGTRVSGTCCKFSVNRSLNHCQYPHIFRCQSWPSLRMSHPTVEVLAQCSSLVQYVRA